MAKVLRIFVIICITLLFDISHGEISRWREFLSKKKFLSHRNGGRIAGGIEATRDQFPFAALFFNYHADGSESACSGSIIATNYVLSAAHCFVSIKSSDLLAGIHDITLEYPQYEFSILPSDVTSHPNYNAVLHANDIAIVSTRRSPFRFTTSIQAIPMAPRSFINFNLTGSTARVAGWGLTSDGGDMSPVPRFIDSLIISNVECARTFGTLILNSNFCLSGAGGRSTCSGDSGGGATITSGNTRYLMGIVSFGSEFGCQLQYPTVKTRITSYYDWITLVTGITIS